MITKEQILDFNSEIKASIKEVEGQISETERKLKELHQKREELGRTYEAIDSIVGGDRVKEMDVMPYQSLSNPDNIDTGRPKPPGRG